MDQHPLQQSNTTPDNFQAEMPVHKSGRGWMVVAILAIVALVVVSVFSYYKWQQYKKLVGSLGADVNSLNAQVSNLKNEVTRISKTTVTTTTQNDAQQIIASSSSYCVGANITQCNPKISKQLTKYADVTLQDGKHLLLVKDSNNNWPVILSNSGSLCQLGTDGEPVVSAIKALCN